MLETVANFLPTPLGMSKSESCSEHLQLRCWNVPASSADHWGPSGTPPMTMFHCRGLRLAWECRKSPVDAHMRFRKSICLMSVHLPRASLSRGMKDEGNTQRLLPTWFPPGRKAGSRSKAEEQDLWATAPSLGSFLDFRSGPAQRYRTGTPFPFTLCFV